MNYYRQEINQALRNLLRNRRRTIVTGLAILSGFTGLTLLAGYVARVERNLMVSTVYINHNGHIQIHKKDGLNKYFSKPRKYLIAPEDELKARDILSRFKDIIEFTSPYMMGNGLLQFDSHAYPFQGKGVTSESDSFTKNHPMVKKWTDELSKRESGTPIANAGSMLNPIKITHKLFNNLGQNKELSLQGLTVDNSFNALDVNVSSLYSTGMDLTEDTGLMSTVDVFRELMATDGTTFLGVYIKNDLDARSLSNKLNEEFKKSSLELEATPFYDERIGLFYTGTMNFLYAMAVFFFSLVSVVVILSIANAISMNIMERIKELGTMRAIGYTPQDISRLMAWESFFLSLVAIGIGYILSQTIAFLVNTANIRFFPPGIAGDMQFVLTPWPSLCIILAIPLIIFSISTAYFITKRKISSEVATLLTETTT